MRRFWPLLLLFAILLVAIVGQQAREPVKPATLQASERIISLAPSLTEIAFSLGLGERLVGVTRYCNYPPQAQILPRIGSFLDPNFDAIVQLQPDLVLLLENNPQLIKQLHQLNIPTLAVNNETLLDIDNAINKIGQYTHTTQQAQTLRTAMHDILTDIQKQIADQAKPRVLIVISRESDNGPITHRYIAGHHDFYHDLIQLAGGINAFPDNKIAIPSLSAEGLLHLNPDVIIELLPAPDEHPFSRHKIKQQWQQLHQISPLIAVQNNQVHIIEADYTTIPGPRLPLLLKEMARLIHPSLEWDPA